MSELARDKDARQLWVSRSHLNAGLMLAFLVAVMCFGLGYLFGRAKVGTAVAGAPVSFTAQVSGTELVELLAEVERNALVRPESAMEYPRWADGEEELEIPKEAPEPAGVDAQVEAPAMPVEPQGDPIPEASFTVRVGVFEDEAAAVRVRDHLATEGLAAWLTPTVDGGQPRWWVGVGGFDTEADAEASRTLLEEPLERSPVAVDGAVVVPLTPR